MASAGDLRLRLDSPRELEQLSRRLKQAGRGDLRKELGRRIRAAAEPAKRDAQSAVQGLQVKGVRGGGGAQRASARRRPSRRSTGLRDTIARSMKVQVTYQGTRTGVSVRADSRQLPNRQRSLPKHLNKGAWRHPVFGNTDVWVTQTASPREWFSKAMDKSGPRARRAVKAAMDDIAKEIAQ